jgi:hypothetical protein
MTYNINDPIPYDELDAIRDNDRPAGWFPTAPCGGCGTVPVWVGGDVNDGGGYVADHTAWCPVAARLRPYLPGNPDPGV